MLIFKGVAVDLSYMYRTVYQRHIILVCQKQFYYSEQGMCQHMNILCDKQTMTA